MRSTTFHRPGSWLAVMLFVVGFATEGAGQPAASAAPPPGPSSNPKPAGTVQPAASLRVRVASTSVAATSLLDPASPAWTTAVATALLLSRTPRVYPSEPTPRGDLPKCKVQAIRSGNQIAFRLHWQDAASDLPVAPEAKVGDGGGEPKHLYRRPTSHPNAFSDAVAIMVPDRWSGPAFPSLMMGAAKEPVTLYYWSATRGGSVLTASGRTTVAPMAGAKLEHRAVYDAGAWTLTLLLPNQPDGYPVSFAIWDGARGDRDGLKFYTVWYVLQTAG